MAKKMTSKTSARCLQALRRSLKGLSVLYRTIRKMSQVPRKRKTRRQSRMSTTKNQRQRRSLLKRAEWKVSKIGLKILMEGQTMTTC